MFGSYLTQGVYAVAGPFQPFGGAVDIIVVEQKDGSFKSSPWYVKFGDFQGAFTSREKVVHISVNDAPAGFHMSLDINGDAYFEKEIESQDTEEGSVRPCSSSSSSDVISLEESVRSEDVLIGQSSSSQAFNGLEPSLSHDGRLRVEIEDVQKEAIFGAHDDSADVGAENPFLNGHVEYSNGSEYGLSYDSRIISETEETDVRSNVVDICFSGDPASIMEAQGANNATESVMEITEPHQDAELKINLLCNTCYENSINNLAEKSAESLSEFRTEATNVVGGDSTELVNGSMIQNGEHNTVLVELGTQILELEFTLQSAQAETDITSSYSFEQLRHDERETSSVANPQLEQCKSSQKLRNGFGTETEGSQGNAKDSNLLSPHKVEEAVVEINESEKPGEKEERKEKDEKIVVSRMPSSSKWNFWSLSFRGSRTEKGTSDHTLLTTSSLRTPTEGLLKENSYYKWSKKTKIRTYVPTSAQLASLKLIDGRNKVTFVFTSVLGKTEVDASIYLWKWNTRIVISDVDGTITKSDVLGHVMPLVGRDWSQDGVTRLFSAIKDNGFEVLFLSARAITQAYLTRKFLLNLKQNGEALPEGPIFISPDGLLPSLYREVIRRAPHEFKISCLEAIRELFPKDINPFYAGFGNRITDEISYLKVGIPKGKIFIINPKGEVVVDNHVDRKSYTSLHALVNDMFPPMSSHEQEEFNSWNYWKVPYPDIEDEINAEKSKNSKKGRK